jgi:YD repeat-containing protein
LSTWDGITDAYLATQQHTYDANNNLVMTTNYQSNAGEFSYIWGYKNTYVIAQASNAVNTNIFNTSFEEQSEGTIGNGQFGDVKTGKKYHNSGSYTFTFTPASTTNLKMSYWYYSGGQWIFSGVVNYASSINQGTRLDEIRVFPADAFMTTLTYNVFGNVTSQTDINNSSTNFEFVSFGRLVVTKDNEGNILQTNDYNYANGN